MSYSISMYNLNPKEINAIKTLYQMGNSSQEIKDLLGLKVTIRSIQRNVKTLGVSRSVGEAFRLALRKGRIDYSGRRRAVKRHRTKLTVGIRYKLLKQANFICASCGAKPPNVILEIDHIDENSTNHTLSNLQVLCDLCNKGKSWSARS